MKRRTSEASSGADALKLRVFRVRVSLATLEATPGAAPSSAVPCGATGIAAAVCSPQNTVSSVSLSGSAG